MSGIWTGVYFLKNLLFLNVILLEPNVITLYCLVSGCTLITTPLLSHSDLADLGARSGSRQSATSLHSVLRSSVFMIGDCFGVPVRKSRSCWPRSYCAGDSPVSLSGVLRSCRRSLTRMAVSMSPVGRTESRSFRFAEAIYHSAF